MAFDATVKYFIGYIIYSLQIHNTWNAVRLEINQTHQIVGLSTKQDRILEIK